MTNPFENTNARYLVLVNARGQHSLWPADIDLPMGWSVAFGPDERRKALDYVEAHWPDLTPLSMGRAA